jgi:hypothetical protein
MELNYFKTNIWGDCYVGDGNIMRIITISKENVSLMADDENIFGGAYKTLEISKKDYNQLKEFAENKDRKGLVNLLKKVHEDNAINLKNNLIMIRLLNPENFEDYELRERLVKDFEEKKPILE